MIFDRKSDDNQAGRAISRLFTYQPMEVKNEWDERTNEKTESVHSMIKESNYEVKIRWLRKSTVYVRANKPTQVATIRYEGMPSSNYGLYDSRGNKLGHIECSPRCFTITGFQTSMSYIDIVGWGNEAKLVAGNMYAPIIRFDKGRYHIFSNRGRVGSIEFGNMLSGQAGAPGGSMSRG